CFQPGGSSVTRAVFQPMWLASSGPDVRVVAPPEQEGHAGELLPLLGGVDQATYALHPILLSAAHAVIPLYDVFYPATDDHADRLPTRVTPGLVEWLDWIDLATAQHRLSEDDVIPDRVDRPPNSGIRGVTCHPSRPSSEHLFDHVPGHVGQALVAAAVQVGQLLVV